MWTAAHVERAWGPGPSYPIPCLVRLFHLAVPGFHPFIVNYDVLETEKGENVLKCIKMKNDCSTLLF